MAYNEHCTKENKCIVVSRVDFAVFKAFIWRGCLQVSLSFALFNAFFILEQPRDNGRSKEEDDMFDLRCTLI